MKPEDENFDPMTATDEQLVLFLARCGVTPIDLEQSKRRMLAMIDDDHERRRRETKSWEELELDRVVP